MNKSIKYSSYQPRTIFSSREIAKTVEELTNNLSKPDKRLLNDVAAEYVSKIPKLGLRGARELVHKLRYWLLLKEKGELE